MYTFNDAMQEVALGGVARRVKWAPGICVSRQGYLFKMQDGKDFVPAFESVRANDWEIVTRGTLGSWVGERRVKPKAKVEPNLGSNTLNQISSDIAFIKNKICLVKSRKEVNGLSADLVELPGLRTTNERMALLIPKKSKKFSINFEDVGLSLGMILVCFFTIREFIWFVS